MRKLLKRAGKISLAAVGGLAIVMGGYASYEKQMSQAETLEQHAEKIFQKILVQTGQVQDAPIFIVNPDESIVNAYATTVDLDIAGVKVSMNVLCIYKGMLEAVKNDDELSMVIGHEMAHIMLGHTTIPEFHKDGASVATIEANADKMGAFYMMKAGYDVCKAREIWKRMRLEEGNYQGLDHPDYSYRYDELDVNCD